VVGGFRADHQVLGAAHAMEAAFSPDAQLRRPRPDLASLRAAVPALTSIVKTPPIFDNRAAGAAAVSVV